jgi:hypothetical protein
MFAFNSTSPDIWVGCLPAISLAAGRGHYSTVQLLLSYDARWYPHSTYEEPNPLLHAVASGHLPVVELLLNHGADPNGVARWYCTSDLIADVPCIYWAVPHSDIFRLLLDRGADLSLPVTKAAIGLRRDVDTGRVVSIFNMREDIWPVVTAPTSMHVLQKALQSGCTETVQIMLDRGISLQASDRVPCWSCKPVLIAAVMGGEAMTRFVLDYGLDVRPGSRVIEQAVYIAISKRDFPSFKLLWERGLLNSACSSSSDRNMLGMPTFTSLPPKQDAEIEPGTSSLPRSPLDHLIEEGVAKGPRNCWVTP